MLANQPKKVAIMQPYFLPYIGYFQLIASVDEFVIYDNIKYTKKGWVNRNRMLLNGVDVMFSLPLKKASDYLNVVDRELADDFDRIKLLNQFKGAYSKAPYFSTAYPLIEKIILRKSSNLFDYIYQSVMDLCCYLDIKTKISISSSLDIDHDLKGQDKVIALCNKLDATTYINAIGGLDLYSRDIFEEQGIRLQFIKAKSFEYAQFGNSFIPWLSVLDVLMFNSPDVIKDCITNNWELV